ncbi:MAG: hypothetical protein K6F77_01140 [Lachnospiraceae bacterium]|nr:hypothetical protein [Lachnospiraceae bacterium]
MNIDINDTINTIKDINGIEPFMEKWTFYYDESGNCRKFALTEKGVNAEDAIAGDFVLAGVAYKGEQYSIDAESLFKIIGIGKNQKEIKFKHLYKRSSSYLSFMNEQRTLKFLEWLENSGLYIHYSTLNNLFYALVDIIDSLWGDFPQCFIYMWEIKSAFYDFTIVHKEEIIALLYKYQYPNVTDCKNFCFDICDLISMYNNEDDYYPGFFMEMIRQMLKSAGKREELIFAQRNNAYVLIEEYYLFYLERAEIFNKSKHYFDEEPLVQEELKNFHLMDGEKEIKNFEFIKSDDSVYIQLSDVVSGLLRKLFMFLDSISMDNLHIVSRTESENQVKCFRIIWKLLSKSDEKSALFLKNVNTPNNINERMEKLRILAHS